MWVYIYNDLYTLEFWSSRIIWWLNVAINKWTQHLNKYTWHLFNFLLCNTSLLPSVFLHQKHGIDTSIVFRVVCYLCVFTCGTNTIQYETHMYRLTHIMIVNVLTFKFKYCWNVILKVLVQNLFEWIYKCNISCISIDSNDENEGCAKYLDRNNYIIMYDTFVSGVLMLT